MPNACPNYRHCPEQCRSERMHSAHGRRSSRPLGCAAAWQRPKAITAATAMPSLAASMARQPTHSFGDNTSASMMTTVRMVENVRILEPAGYYLRFTSRGSSA